MQQESNVKPTAGCSKNSAGSRTLSSQSKLKSEPWLSSRSQRAFTSSSCSSTFSTTSNGRMSSLKHSIKSAIETFLCRINRRLRRRRLTSEDSSSTYCLSEWQLAHSSKDWRVNAVPCQSPREKNIMSLFHTVDGKHDCLPLLDDTISDDVLADWMMY
eukprot:m.371321 g.371321  ORF g.371321 m.371321 type:complete len:158 (+) comp58209_c0_seq1:183-656(+)